MARSSRRGYGYLGTDKIERTSKNKEDILHNQMGKTEEITKNIKEVYRFTFDNKDDCTVYINGSEYGIFLEAGDGWDTTAEDAPITSFEVSPKEVRYKFTAHY